MESHLLQMRGLKRCKLLALAQKEKSHLLQMRGLKHLSFRYKRTCHIVASFTDAWIETILEDNRTLIKRRIFYRCVD